MERNLRLAAALSHHPQVESAPPKVSKVWKLLGPWQTPLGTPDILSPRELRQHTRDHRGLWSLLGCLSEDKAEVGLDLQAGRPVGSGSVDRPRERRGEAAQGLLDRLRDTPGCSHHLAPPQLHTRVHTASQHCQPDQRICREPMVTHCPVVELLRCQVRSIEPKGHREESLQADQCTWKDRRRTGRRCRVGSRTTIGKAPWQTLGWLDADRELRGSPSSL